VNCENTGVNLAGVTRQALMARWRGSSPAVAAVRLKRKPDARPRTFFAPFAIFALIVVQGRYSTSPISALRLKRGHLPIASTRAAGSTRYGKDDWSSAVVC